MKKPTYFFSILLILCCSVELAVQTNPYSKQSNASSSYATASADRSLNSLVTRVHKLLDAVDQGCGFIYGLWEPFPNAVALTRKHPYLSIMGTGGLAYLYKKEKKAAYISLAVMYAALYYRIQKNKHYGLAARYKLRRREALAMPLEENNGE